MMHAPVEQDMSSEEDDAFAKLAENGKTIVKTDAASVSAPSSSHAHYVRSLEKAAPSVMLPVSTTSSMKRHHVTSNDSRKAKMNALLIELETRKPMLQARGRGFVPEKKGSFVAPGEEHLTTNIFVGNLAPCITEEELADLFRQFGDLYSVKIMWPRTPEERARSRNTGFVCFMNREDAEDAMLCDETDPFNVGRRIMMRWGKNVKKFIKKGSGGVASIPERASSSVELPNKRCKVDLSPGTDDAARMSARCKLGSEVVTGAKDPYKRRGEAVLIASPRLSSRALFIATVASFVARDGDMLERMLLKLEANNRDFSFLSLPNDLLFDNDAKEWNEKKQQQWCEYMFYRWRVYAFCQGSGFNVWRTDPFIVICPCGNFWIPPVLNHEAAEQEEQEMKVREEDVMRQKKRRRQRITAGRQPEHVGARGNLVLADGGVILTPEEVEIFNTLVRKQLCASRESICRAMAYCFEKSGAAKQIAEMLKDLLLEDQQSMPCISVETRVARLYLLSDVLFNSQQPGVRNAFLYRDSVGHMAPEIFSSFGKHGGGFLGRMTKNKLSTAVSGVLAAWTNWSVYSPSFLDELHAKYVGRAVKTKSNDSPPDPPFVDVTRDDNMNATAVKVITDRHRQRWTEVMKRDLVLSRGSIDSQQKKGGRLEKHAFWGRVERDGDRDCCSNIHGHHLNGDPLDDDDLDGEPL